MNRQTAERLPENTPVRHPTLGDCRWITADSFDKTTCYIKTANHDEYRVDFASVEVR